MYFEVLFSRRRPNTQKLLAHGADRKITTTAVPHPPGSVEDGSGQRVVTALFGGGGQAQDLVLRGLLLLGGLVHYVRGRQGACRLANTFKSRHCLVAVAIQRSVLNQTENT
jgi:hypothetical protein